MEQNTLILDVLEDMFEYWTQKLILGISTSIDKLCLQDVMEEEQVLLNKIETNLKVDSKMISCKNNLEKDTILDLQMKPANAHLQTPPMATTAVAATAAASVVSTTPQSLKLTYPEILDRIKEEFQFLQNQYHSLKLECEKLATEKTEIQRHYVMYYEMSYGLNIEMHKQHQQQVVQAVERAKQVTVAELNVAIG
ncbi:PREDICTED: transducin-like enhancer protein 1, partial [Thamnophis sirtalis]|uniref:Transducin-like enhancer protein 1 n=1 Tax=Thamnophis sirtalis TaxID=35019 RepID=A0A6I9XWX4_9SAUR